MSYAIVGFGEIGQALAHAFARKNIDVTVASRRPPEALAPQARAIGPTVVAKSLRDALEADTIILAVPFGEHGEVAKALPSWEGKTVIDAMNTLVPLEELDGLLSSAFVAKSFTGAKFVKGFNHLVAATLATDPIVEGGHRVVFLSSDDEDAIAPEWVQGVASIQDTNAHQGTGFPYVQNISFLCYCPDSALSFSWLAQPGWIPRSTVSSF